MDSRSTARPWPLMAIEWVAKVIWIRPSVPSACSKRNQGRTCDSCRNWIIRHAGRLPGAASRQSSHTDGEVDVVLAVDMMGTVLLYDLFVVLPLLFLVNQLIAAKKLFW